ncbi:flagellar assembly protein FliW [Sporosarcina gallistercoris]|uniref:Flagellar assembly factor FliW n=1 Tax=Sporosarcina gallistercoris TaxID=2762245 RepID=A0ABR8PN47_9BACL|nr:flagellar assembly protein FliW [Sporosarcina gallistercoris]MBD7909605.1 flagellar assembly protein FliW [Sporosarcina gallistercoris]
MKIKTKFHGELDIEGVQKWTFPNGLPGLEGEKQFVLLPIEGNDSFRVMQSTVNASIALIVCSPYTLLDSYEISIDEPTLGLLNIKEPDEVMVLSVMSLKQPFEESTINLQAPLILNSTNLKAKQMILNDSQYSLRQSIDVKAKKGAR